MFSFGSRANPEMLKFCDWATKRYNLNLSPRINTKRVNAELATRTRPGDRHTCIKERGASFSTRDQGERR
jgi:hypothetical protein